MKGIRGIEPRTWVRAWLAVTVGTLLGWYIFPTLRWKFSQNSDWSSALQYGGSKLWENGFPTVGLYTAMLAIILLGIFLNKKKS